MTTDVALMCYTRPLALDVADFAASVTAAFEMHFSDTLLLPSADRTMVEILADDMVLTLSLRHRSRAENPAANGRASALVIGIGPRSDRQPGTLHRNRALILETLTDLLGAQAPTDEIQTMTHMVWASGADLVAEATNRIWNGPSCKTSHDRHLPRRITPKTRNRILVQTGPKSDARTTEIRAAITAPVDVFEFRPALVGT